MWLNFLFITIGYSFWILWCGTARCNWFCECSTIQEGRLGLCAFYLLSWLTLLLQCDRNAHCLTTIRCNTSQIKRQQSLKGYAIILKECGTSEPATIVKETELMFAILTFSLLWLPLYTWAQRGLSCFPGWNAGPNWAPNKSGSNSWTSLKEPYD